MKELSADQVYGFDANESRESVHLDIICSQGLSRTKSHSAYEKYLYLLRNVVLLHAGALMVVKIPEI